MEPVVETPVAAASSPAVTPAAVVAPAATLPRPCAHCAAPLADDQDWCLECGAGAPALGAGHPVWRPAATVLALTAVLVIGTVAVAYAALRAPSRRTVTRPAVVALVPPTHTVAPAPLPAAPPVIGPTHTPPPAARLTPIPPKTASPPSAAVTPAPVVHPTITRGTSSTNTQRTTSSSATQPRPNPSTPAPTPQGAPVVLDATAASTYNPNGYPPSAFPGDPSFAIDGDPATAWSAQAQSGRAPMLDAGVVIDLNAPQHLASLKLISDTPGLSVGIYAANGHQPPTDITSSRWNLLSPVRRTARTSTFTLGTSGARYRFVLVWVTRVPRASTTADLNEISLTH